MQSLYFLVPGLGRKESETGLGDPFERAPQAVLDDVLDELVSPEAARSRYGVELTGSLPAGDLAVDEPATRQRRARRKD